LRGSACAVLTTSTTRSSCSVTAIEIKRYFGRSAARFRIRLMLSIFSSIIRTVAPRLSSQSVRIRIARSCRLPGAFIKKSRGTAISDVNKSYWMNSVRDAPVRSGRYPIIIFSHGNGGSRYQNTFWCDYVASHGYIIVSADHTGNAGVTILKDGNVPYQGSERISSAADRPKDMSYLLDQMTKWNAGAEGSDPRFKGRIDLERPCAAGMSFGSMTAVRVADTDSRFKSVIAMSGAYPQHTNLKVPTLWMIGTEDRTIGPIGNSVVRGHHEKHEGPSYLLELKNGGHYSFTDMFKMNPNHGDGVGKGVRREGGAEFEFTSMETTYKIINSYSVAFLSVYLKGDMSGKAFLHENHWPTDLIWLPRNSDK